MGISTAQDEYQKRNVHHKTALCQGNKQVYQTVREGLIFNTQSEYVASFFMRCEC